MDQGYEQLQPKGLSGRNVAIAVYILYAAGIFVGLTYIVGVIVAYVKRDEVEDVWKTHLNGQISLFWKAFIGWIVGVATAFVVIGWFILIAVAIYTIYKIVVGLIRALENKPVA